MFCAVYSIFYPLFCVWIISVVRVRVGRWRCEWRYSDRGSGSAIGGRLCTDSSSTTIGRVLRGFRYQECLLWVLYVWSFESSGDVSICCSSTVSVFEHCLTYLNARIRHLSGYDRTRRLRYQTGVEAEMVRLRTRLQQQNKVCTWGVVP